MSLPALKALMTGIPTQTKSEMRSENLRRWSSAFSTHCHRTSNRLTNDVRGTAMSGTKPSNPWGELQDSCGDLGAGLEDYPPDARLDAIYAAAEARLKAEFARHRGDLLGHLQKVCECPPKTKSFDPDRAWISLSLLASRYLIDEAYVEEKRMMEPAADRVKRLRQLGNALWEARCKLDEWRHHVICGVLFEEWCKARGISDFTD